MTKGSSELVPLKDGPAVPLAAILLHLALEERGFSVRVEGSLLCIAPASQLTAADHAAIRQHRDALFGIATYCETARVQ